MKEQIKQLRVKIDGIAQLTKESNKVYFIDTSKLPENLKTSEILEQIKQSGIYLSEGREMEYINPSKQLENAYESLMLGKAWLGKVLGVLGEESPYANDGKRKEIKDIEPTADKEGFFLQDDWNEKNHIEKVDWLRQEMLEVLHSLENIEGEVDPKVNTEPSCKLERYTNQAIYHLMEARFWLGFELERIKNS